MEHFPTIRMDLHIIQQENLEMDQIQQALILVLEAMVLVILLKFNLILKLVHYPLARIKDN